jgi:hypothetical protein
MRTLMHIKICSHAMTRAMKIVKPLAPHILSGKDVDLSAAGAGRELTELYLDMAFEHKGIDTTHLFCERPESNGTGDVRGAIEILGSAVEQEQALWLQGDIGLWGSLIMHNGAMSLISGDGIKGDVTIERLLSTKSGKLLVDSYFRQSGYFGIIR